MPISRNSIVTITLIAICAVVALLSGLGSSPAVLQYLFIATPGTPGYQDVMNGQIWRLVTPIFIHFGILHIVFNLMWIWDLGKMIEGIKGARFYSVFVLLVGIASNVMQYSLTQSPYFGGMSGVIYGLLGYVWMQLRYRPGLGFELHKNTVLMMLVWYVVCWTGLLGPIANWAHTG
ncbi:rhomboid family intramembrane serine protease [Undibacterium sp.]|jgi:GlpG protein|uniref:rhomboid family intramembrane serine protease n=1 Tax=Undibacterium sp. TaxID=1914977 RepID=UPI002C867A1B|nr:rhomboid family intramembrane serine protease [Undibacterium sp.]HTD03433.1 rhomboid family intramembrane serine protease [Undibacterium sp.]